MPGDSEHPVTLGDLRVQIALNRTTSSWNYRPATVADLVSALRAEGVLVVEKEGVWPDWVFGLLEEAQKQPFPEPWEVLDALVKEQTERMGMGLP